MWNILWVFSDLFSCFCLNAFNVLPTNGTPSYAQDVFSLYDQRMNDAGVKVLPSDVKRGHQFSCTKVHVIPPCPDYLEGSLSGLTFMQLSEIHLSKSRIVDAVLQHQC